MRVAGLRAPQPQRSMKLAKTACLVFLSYGTCSAASDSKAGNELCWASQNFESKVLTYEHCCHSEHAARECFDGMFGWYSYDFCCLEPVPEHKNCSWQSVIDRIDEELVWLDNFPVALREVCCVYPHSGCWGEADGSLPAGFSECCFPILRRSLLAAGGDTAWVEHEVDLELEALQGMRWSTSDLDAFEQELDAARELQPGLVGSLPCRVRMRNGGLEFLGCDAAQCQSSIDQANDCSYVQAVETALKIINVHLPLPDLDIFVSPSNNDAGELPVPVFTRHRPREPRGLFILLPFEWQLHPWQSRKTLAVMPLAARKNPWHVRAAKLLWRGTNSNQVDRACSMQEVSEGQMPWSSCLSGWKEELFGQSTHHAALVWNSSNWYDTPRGTLVMLSRYVEHIDAKFTGTSNDMEPTLWDYLERHKMTASALDPSRQMSHRYGINIDGAGNGDRIFWQMLGGQLVLNHDSPQVSWLFTDLANPETRGTLKPFEHFVPVRFDLADLVGRIEWLQRHDSEAERIAETGRRFAERHLGYDGVLFYVDRVMRRFASNHLRL